MWGAGEAQPPLETEGTEGPASLSTARVPGPLLGLLQPNKNGLSAGAAQITMHPRARANAFLMRPGQGKAYALAALPPCALHHLPWTDLSPTSGWSLSPSESDPAQFLLLRTNHPAPPCSSSPPCFLALRVNHALSHHQTLRRKGISAGEACVKGILGGGSSMCKGPEALGCVWIWADSGTYLPTICILGLLLCQILSFPRAGHCLAHGCHRPQHTVHPANNY